MKLRSCLLAAFVAAACGGSGTSSTGVGNPGVIALAIVTDDEIDPDTGGSAEGGSAGRAGENEARAGEGGLGGTTEAAAEEPLQRGAVYHAILVLAGLRWLPCDAALQPTLVSGPFVVDLVEKRTEPPIPSVSAPPGGFCGIDAPLAPARRPGTLAGRSLFFDGQRADGTFFLLYADMEGTLRLRTANDASWSGDEALLWAFRPRRWLTREELDTATATPRAGSSPAIVIDVDRYPLLYRAIRARLAGRSTLYADVNGNGVLDIEDRASTRGLGLEDAD